MSDALSVANSAGANALSTVGGSAAGNSIGRSAAAARAGLNAGLAIYNNLPKTYGVVTVRVWAQKGTSKSAMYNIAASVILSRTQLTPLFMGRTDSHWTEDVAGRFVEVGVSYECGPVATLAALAAANAGQIVNIAKASVSLADAIALATANQEKFAIPGFPGTDDVNGVFQSADSPGFSPPNDSGTRGTYTAQLFAAAVAS